MTRRHSPYSLSVRGAPASSRSSAARYRMQPRHEHAASPAPACPPFGGSGKRAHNCRMMPAQIVPARIPMRPDRRPSSPARGEQRLVTHRLEIGVGRVQRPPAAAPPKQRRSEPRSSASIVRRAPSTLQVRLLSAISRSRAHARWRGRRRSRPEPRCRVIHAVHLEFVEPQATVAQPHLQDGDPAHAASAAALRAMAHSTISAVSTTAWNSTFAPFSAQSGVISSASLWREPVDAGAHHHRRRRHLRRPAGVVPRPRDDVAVRVAEPLGRAAAPARPAPARRSPGRNARPPRPRSRRPSASQIAAASASIRARIRSSFAWSGERMSTVKTTSPGSTLREFGLNVTCPTPPTAVRLLRHRHRLHHLEDPRHRQPGVHPHRHRRRAGMRLPAGQGELEPPEPLAVGDDADLPALGLEDRPLLDVQLEIGVHLPRARPARRPSSRSARAPSPNALPVEIGPRIGVVEVDAPRRTRPTPASPARTAPPPRWSSW